MALNPLSELLKRLLGGSMPQDGDTRAPIEQVALGSAPSKQTEEPDNSLFAKLFPSDPAKKDALRSSLLTTGAGMMMAGGPSRMPTNVLSVIGSGLAAGAPAYDAALESGQKRQAAQIKLAQAQKLQDMQAGLFGGSGVGPGTGGDNGEFGYSISELKKYLQYQIAAGDDAGARDTLGMIQKLQQEAASKGMIVGADGSLEAAPGYNEGLGTTEQAKAAGRVQGEEAYKQTDDIREYNLYVKQTEEAGETPEDFTTWMRKGKAAGATKINVGENSNKFAEESDKAAAKRMDEYIVQGGKAKNLQANVKQFIDLSQKVQTGKGAEIKAAIGPYARMVGIDIDGLSEIEAMDSITQNMLPSMRVPGEGSQSDTELLQKLKGLVSISKTPEGNKILSVTLNAVSDTQIAAAELARKATRGEISWQDAEEQIAALPSPFVAYENYMAELGENGSDKSEKKTNRVVKTQSGEPQPGYEEDGYIFQGGDPSDPKNWLPKNLL